MGKHYIDSREDDLPPSERLQPYLLDRLTRDPSDPARDTFLPPDKFKERIRRDLAFILNARAHPEHEMLEKRYPLVAGSAMNFGLPIMSGLTVAGLDPAVIVDQVREAILNFEPRILPKSLKVYLPRGSLESNRAVGSSLIELIIEADVVGLSEHLAFRTSLNVETGSCNVEDDGNG